MLTSAERLADLLIRAPIVDRLGLTVASELVRRSAAEAVATYVVRNLDRDVDLDRDQLALPL